MSGDLHLRKTAPARARFLKIDYQEMTGSGVLPENAMAIVRFGKHPEPPPFGTLSVDVDLHPLRPAPVEIWSSDEPISTGCEGPVRFACDSSFVFGVIEANERDFKDIRDTTAYVYAAIQRFQRTAGFAHLLRMWNFLDAVNEGAGDLERYRQFCVGRAQGLAASITGQYPAATAIGRQHSTGVLQVFWIGAKDAGMAIENPRQVSAYRYPRSHGPVSPSFSRATASQDGTLLISGTASIVGHASRHPDDVIAQLDETLLNLEALVQHARKQRSVASGQSPLLLKVYVRDPADLKVIATRLQAAYPNDEMIFLAADICRRELLLEIECVLQPL